MANELKTAEMLSSKVTSDKQENVVQSQNNPSNRDVNGVNDKNGVSRDKHLVNDSKTQLDKKPTANGDIKPPSSLPELKKEKSALKTPTKKISPKSPEITSASSLGEKKKVPMNKVQVGAAPSPNLKVVRSKIGSLENYTHKPGGGRVKIENRKLEWKVQPKIEAKNDKYAPSGGDKKITQVKLQWSAKSKIGSLENATHKPGGGDKKIESVKLDFKDKAKPKVGSKDNIKHVPGGGIVKKTTDVDAKSTSSNIEDQKLDIKAQSKVGSLDNVKHRPGGGDKKIFDDKEYLKQTALTNESSKANSVTTSGSQVPEDSQICSRDSQPKEKQPAAAGTTITPQKSDKPAAKDQVKSKDESKSPKNDKKSQPSTPKKSLSKENKSLPLTSSKPNEGDETASEKIPQKSDTKVDQKTKQDSMPQLKPELKRIPSKEKIKDEINLKSKVPVAQPRELVKMPSKEKIKDEINSNKDNKASIVETQKQNFEPVSKPIEKTIPDKNASENKSKPIKEVAKNENNKVDTTIVDKKSEKSTDVQQISKTESENTYKSNLNAKPSSLKKQDSKSKIEPKLNLDKNLSVEITVLKKQDSKSKIELETDKTQEKKESIIQDPKSSQIESKTNISNKDPTKTSSSVELNKPNAGADVKNTELKQDSCNLNLKPNIEVKITEIKDQPKLPSAEQPIKEQSNLKTSNNSIERPNTEKHTKINEPIKPPSNSSPQKNDEKSKLPKTDKNQNDVIVKDSADTKHSPEKFSQLETKQTSETFNPISKSASDPRPSTATLNKKSSTISESKITNIPTHNEKLTPSNQTENLNKSSLITVKCEKDEPFKNKVSETPSIATSQSLYEPSKISLTSELRK